MGRLGLKTGKGFYNYTKPPQSAAGVTGFRGQPDPVVEAVVSRERDRKAREIFGTVSPVSGSQSTAAAGRSHCCSPEMKQHIQERLLYPLVNEAFKLLGEGGVPSDRPGDVDIIFLRGYGWPPYKGGPLFFADRIVTLPVLLRKLNIFARAFPATDYYRPAPLLIEMVKRCISVQDLQRNPSLVVSLMNNRNKSFL